MRDKTADRKLIKFPYIVKKKFHSRVWRLYPILKQKFSCEGGEEY